MTPAHDVAGVGIGPFNLGLAALLDGVAELDAIFFDGPRSSRGTPASCSTRRRSRCRSSPTS